MTTTTDKPLYSTEPPTEPGWYWLKWPMYGLTIGRLYGDSWVTDRMVFHCAEVNAFRGLMFGPKVEPPPENETTHGEPA